MSSIIRKWDYFYSFTSFILLFAIFINDGFKESHVDNELLALGYPGLPRVQ